MADPTARRAARRRLREITAAAAAVAVLAGAVSPAVARAPVAAPLTATAQTQASVYPDPPPDFAHPDSPHSKLFSLYGGSLDRPLLVVYLHFSDAPEPPGMDLAWARQRFFGPAFPNLAGWYAANSFGQLTLFPAEECPQQSTAERCVSQGTPDDGVVQVEAESIEDYNSVYNDPLPDEGSLNRRLVELADPYVDFSNFDTDGNGVITDEELVIANLRVHTDDSGNAGVRSLCEGTPAPCPEVIVDGKTISPTMRFPMGLHATNRISWVHEIGHVVVDLLDLYYNNQVEGLDPGGTTGGTDTTSFSASAWSKVHWGWIQPTVITRDGFYDVPLAYTTGAAFILYDPDRGTDDYFIVENRRPTPGTYDQSAADDGLVIWRIDETKFVGAQAGLITTRQPNQNQVAWDPSDSQSPERTMTSPWSDGTASNLAVRAIGPKGDVVRAYFDVRGPGVLVDTYPVDVLGPPKLVAGALQTLAVPVMNTGEVVDTFEFSFTGLPTGWTAVPRSVTLAPGVPTTLNLDLTPAHDDPEAILAVSVTGTSLSDPSVTSTDSLDVQVVHISDLAILGVEIDDVPDEMVVGEPHPVTVRTQVTNHGPSWPTDATVTGSTVPSAGGAATPASWTHDVPALTKDAVREISDVVDISCQGAGRQAYTVNVEIAPTLATETDLDHTNDVAQATIVTDCVVPVAINIKPGGFPNAINLRGTAPVAVLTTTAGEYDLPLAFDATTIDASSVRFGPASLVFPETGGARAMHATVHLEDAWELDEKTRDGDIDMVLQFRVADSGLTAASTEACVKGTFTAADGAINSFFGCDSVTVSK
jgi:M6 family metalloprotease-like protein